MTEIFEEKQVTGIPLARIRCSVAEWATGWFSNGARLGGERGKAALMNARVALTDDEVALIYNGLRLAASDVDTKANETLELISGDTEGDPNLLNELRKLERLLREHSAALRAMSDRLEDAETVEVLS